MTLVANDPAKTGIYVLPMKEAPKPPEGPKPAPKGAYLYTELYHQTNLIVHAVAAYLTPGAYVLGFGTGVANSLYHRLSSGINPKTTYEDQVADDFGQAQSFWEKFGYLQLKLGAVLACNWFPFGDSKLPSRACGFFYGLKMGNDLSDRAIKWLNISPTKTNAHKK